MVVSFIDGGNRSTRTRPPTCRKSLTNFNVVLSGIRTHKVKIIIVYYCFQQRSYVRQSVEPHVDTDLPVVPVAGGEFDEEDIPDNEVSN